MKNIPADIMESLPLGVLVIDRDGQMEEANRCARKLLNFNDRPIAKNSLFSVFGNDPRLLATNLCRPEPQEGHRRHKIKYNGKILGVIGSPLINGNGEPSGSVILIEDITEDEKDQELEKIREKYVLIGEFSADIAHEIRNPLGSIQLLACLLQKELRRKRDVTRVNQILSTVEKIGKKISSLVALSKAAPIPVELVNIHGILKEILSLSEERTDREPVFVSAQYADLEPVIECNPEMVKQLLLHFILSALQALPETSRLEIITRHIEACRMVEIMFIERDGAAPEGVPSKILDHLSHQKERGWGLGLAILHNIVNICHGQMRMEYLARLGTAFVLSFPLAPLKGSGMEVATTPNREETDA